ncbi:hypothetical protein K2Y11_23650 [bacterium]|nr:hypothetical protein [bacterium]
MRHSFSLSAIALMMVLFSASPLRADLTITTDTTQNGGTLVVDPAGVLLISDPMNDPLLTLTNGASSSGIQALLVGNLNGEGRLLIEEGSTLNSSLFALLGVSSGSEGTATVTDANSKWISGSGLTVGVSGTGTLNIENAGTVTNTNGTIADGAESVGTVNVSGVDSSWQNTGKLIVGSNGNGTLNISEGGKVTSTNSYIADQFGSSGIVKVTGTDSHWSTNQSLHVGNSGQGILSISDGGIATSNFGYVGNGTVTVTGTESQWQNERDIYVGYSGTGILNIKDGGYVSNGVAHVASNSRDYAGTVNIIGHGSTWDNFGRLYVGELGVGTVNILDGGRVASSGIFLGGTSYGSAGAINVVGKGSQLQTTTVLQVGSSTPGSLTILQGGVVVCSDGYLSGRFHFTDSVGTATVDGLGSLWQNSGTLTIGNLGSTFGGIGSLTIQNGGVVTSSDGWIGQYGQATTTINGDGSQWRNRDDLHVGDSGVGELTIENGGLVTTKILTIGSDGTGELNVEGNKSTLSIEQMLTIGKGYGDGALNINNGGFVSSLNGVIGSDSEITDPVSKGVVKVSGIDSVLDIGGTLSIGDFYSSGQLYVDQGASVKIGLLLTVNMHGTLSGNGGTIIGDVLNQGTIAPGNSPGILTIHGDLQSTGLIQLQLAGTGTGYFDQLIVNGQLNLGGTIEVDLLDGFNPSVHNSFKILGFNSLINSGYRFDFSHAALQPSFSWDTSTFAVDGTIRVIPEASSVLLAGIATFAGLLVARR